MTREYQAEQPKLTPLAEERLDDDEPPTPPHDFRDLTIEEKRELIDRFATELLLLYLPKSVCKVSDMLQIKTGIMNAMIDVLNDSSEHGILYDADVDRLPLIISDWLGITRDPATSDEAKRKAEMGISGKVFRFYLDFGFVPEEYLNEFEWAEDDE